MAHLPQHRGQIPLRRKTADSLRFGAAPATASQQAQYMAAATGSGSLPTRAPQHRGRLPALQQQQQQQQQATGNVSIAGLAAFFFSDLL